MTAPQGYMSVNQAMEALGISRQRVYQLIGLRRLPADKRGSRVWIPIEAVNERLAGEQRLASNQCITTQEVAEFFGVNERTVREWHSNGLLRAQVINNLLCFSPTEVTTFTPPSTGGAGRNPKHAGTRTLRGRHYPVPKPPREES